MQYFSSKLYVVRAHNETFILVKGCYVCIIRIYGDRRFFLKVKIIAFVLFQNRPSYATKIKDFLKVPYCKRDSDKPQNCSLAS